MNAESDGKCKEKRIIKRLAGNMTERNGEEVK